MIENLDDDVFENNPNLPVSTKRKYPIHPEKMRYMQNRFLERGGSRDVMIKIESMFALECQLVLHAYYGGPIRAGWWLLRYGITNMLTGWYWDFVWWFSDRIGWTKIYHIPETTDYIAHWRRHGKQCSGSPNCQDDDCITKAVPHWYKKVTRMNKFEL